MTIVLNPSSHARLDALSSDLPQSLLITGEQGVGLATIARNLAGRNLSDVIEPLNSKAAIDHETGIISVDTVRQLYDHTRTKQTTRRIIIIDDAERMSQGAQAAFLKLLEEPNETTHFILTSHAPYLLLPTIRSRVQTLIVERITSGQSLAYLEELGITDATRRTQMMFLAGGLPAELTRLAQNEAYFARRAEIMSDARSFLAASLYEKLLIAQKYRQNRADALRLCDSALAITRHSLSQKPQPALVGQLDKLLTTRDKIAAHHNIRLQLLDTLLGQ